MTRTLEEEFAALGEEVREWDEYWIERAKSDFTEWVATRMEELGINRADLANELGTHRSYVTEILKGNANFTLVSMVKIARALKCDGIQIEAVGPVREVKNLNPQNDLPRFPEREWNRIGHFGSKPQ